MKPGTTSYVAVVDSLWRCGYLETSQEAGFGKYLGMSGNMWMDLALGHGIWS